MSIPYKNRPRMTVGELVDFLKNLCQNHVINCMIDGTTAAIMTKEPEKEDKCMAGKPKPITFPKFPIEVKIPNTNTIGWENSDILMKVKIVTVKQILSRCNGNRHKAAEILGISDKSLRNFLDKVRSDYADIQNQ